MTGSRRLDGFETKLAVTGILALLVNIADVGTKLLGNSQATVLYLAPSPLWLLPVLALAVVVSGSWWCVVGAGLAAGGIIGNAVSGPGFIELGPGTVGLADFFIPAGMLVVAVVLCGRLVSALHVRFRPATHESAPPLPE